MHEDELAEAEKTKALLPEPLRNVLAMGDPFPEEPWLIRKLIHLAAAVKVAATDSADRLKQKGAGLDQREQRAIGDMVTIPHGPFLYDEDKRPANIDQDFEIDVYPVTNGQYRKFIDDGGYKKDQFWSKEGRVWLRKIK